MTTADINRVFALRIIKSNPHTAAIFNEMLAALENVQREIEDVVRNVNRGYSYGGAVTISSQTKESIKAAIKTARGQ